ncbi:MAG: type IX secretion system membrane protein PorP/SprF [Bacteroidales bacterium]|nr:type IX secretion system membrane protein PorP/SprF [Bacteroidales bacterium]
MKERVKKLFIICYLLLLSGFIYAQQLPLYSQYMMNGFLVNPAMAGSDGYTTASLTTRDHWLGFENSPKTYAISLQSRILWQKSRVTRKTPGYSGSLSKKSGRVGLGGYIFNDKNALVNRTGFQFSYAYHLFIRNTQLSFGLAASAFQFKIDESKLDPRDPEPLLAEGFDNLIYVPDFTFGVYLLNRRSFLGLSAAQLFQTRIRVGQENVDYRMKRHYYLMGGYRFDTGNDTELEPSFLLKGTELGFIQTDVNLKLIYKEFYWAGISYRTQTSVGLLLGGKAGKFYFGYAFDYNLSNIRKYTFGSHEINLAVKFGDNSRRYRWLIRY